MLPAAAPSHLDSTEIARPSSSMRLGVMCLLGRMLRHPLQFLCIHHGYIEFTIRLLEQFYSSDFPASSVNLVHHFLNRFLSTFIQDEESAVLRACEVNVSDGHLNSHAIVVVHE